MSNQESAKTPIEVLPRRVAYSCTETKVFHLYPYCRSTKKEILLVGAKEFLEKHQVNQCCSFCRKRYDKGEPIPKTTIDECEICQGSIKDLTQGLGGARHYVCLKCGAHYYEFAWWTAEEWRDRINGQE